MYIDGSDFFFASQDVIFIAGNVNNTFNVTINDDDIFENNETFNLILLTVTPSRSISIANGTTTVIILDNDREL